jgi:ankyrin repeat protein
VVAMLLKHGATVSLQDSTGKRAMYYAQAAGLSAIARMLKQAASE